MKRLGLGVTVVSFVVGFAGCSSSSPSDSSDPSDTSATGQAILREGVADAMVEGHAPTSVLVFLKGSADLATPAGFAGFATRAERGAFVHTRLVDHAKASQRSLLDALTKEGAKVRPFHIVNAVLVNDASPRLLRQLAARADVKSIAVDKAIPLKLVPNDETQQTEAVEAIGSNITATGANRVWTEFGVKGEGVVIAGQDTGVNWNHPALKSHYRGWDGTTADHGYSWHDAIHETSQTTCPADQKAPCDDYGHGTHTIGTVVGDDGGTNQIGMAPGAKWIACRNMDGGVGTPSSYLECSQWFLAPYPQGADPSTGDPSKAPDVINNSWGCPTSEGCTTGKELVDVVHSLASAGIVFVASAGNSGSVCGSISDQPATIWDATLSVGSYNHRNGAISSFSSRGPSRYPGEKEGHIGPDVAAPGESINSAEGSGYASMSGTSMAGPHVVGEVALLISAKPALRGNVAEITNIVTSTATAKTSTQSCEDVSGSAHPNNTWGYGIIDAYAAVKSVR